MCGTMSTIAIIPRMERLLLQKLIDFGHSTILPGRGRIKRWNSDIYYVGFVLSAMLPPIYAQDMSAEGVASRQLVLGMLEINGKLQYSAKGKEFERVRQQNVAEMRASEVLEHPFVQSGKELASKWPMYA